ncbi:MAG TPA: thioredoxin domain-containing protein [Vicinamibacterales bacterium]|nr:thioredoxin domain-containing protein [Vicinamibacterales bacterium]
MNRLAKERSPYLLQHANNPVDWYAWNEEAFERARREDRPIFLSIGYSTCHWCHVMEHESFESPEIAELLNRDFVSIKVDREERPDVDRVYMSFVQATTGQGGWPMTVFLRPDLKPFFGGTYFPPVSRWGRPGFADLVKEIARVWKEDRARVDEAATELTERLRAVTSGGRPESEIADRTALDTAVAQFRGAFDERRGGFGSAPKFPRPSELLFLLREYARVASQPALQMAVATLRAMAIGGMRDHVGGGFHRYSVDGDWRVPHFEKMLYDQAQLVVSYLEAAQATRDGFFAAVAEDTLQYVLRDMTDAGGGFYSAEDADSVPPEEARSPGPHKREGAFYVWGDEEIGALLGDDAAIARRRFGIEPGGNAPEDPHGEFAGKNLLYIAQPVADIATRAGRPEAEVRAALERIRRTLFEARQRRPRPHLDDKVLTAWNGLMIAAFARAARVLPHSVHAGTYASAAERAATFIHERLWRPGDRTLLRRYRDGEAAIDAYAEDYAYLIWGLLELFQATGSARWLEWALALQERQDELFWDDADGAWFSTTGMDPSVLLRLKEDYDGAEPSASSVGALNALTLAHLTGDDGYRERVRRTLARYGPRVGAVGRVIPMMLCALSQWHAPAMQIVVVGGPAAAPVRELEREIASHYLPFAVHVPVDPDGNQAALERLLPFVDGMKPHGGGAVYVCRDFTCRQPVSSPDALRAELR